jgi:hypothetical protein
MVNQKEDKDSKKISGYHGGSVDTVLSVDDVAKEAAQLAKDRPGVEHLD